MITHHSQVKTPIGYGVVIREYPEKLFTVQLQSGYVQSFNEVELIEIVSHAVKCSNIIPSQAKATT